LFKILSSPSIASKRWVYQQFDHEVKLGTVIKPGGDAAVFRVLCDEQWKYLAATIDCNARYCYLNPRLGACHAVVEAIRNLACVGARPLGATDNLNFANPNDPEIFWQLRECVEGMAEACRYFNIPITGGNVSLYNQSPAGPIDPTPTFGLVGLIEDEKMITSHALNSGVQALVLLGTMGDEIGASAYAYEIHGIKGGAVPAIDMAFESRIVSTLLEAIRNGWIRMAHDLSEGGLAVALAESFLSDPSEYDLTITIPNEYDLCTALFNETSGRILIGIAANDLGAIQSLAQAHNIPSQSIGTYSKAQGKANAQLHIHHRKQKLAFTKDALRLAYESTLPSLLA
jgi:phosphoribosylformylglycinamidine (FGAM) synthase-like enzyme